MTTVRELKEQLEKLDDNLQIYVRDKEQSHDLQIYSWIGRSEYYTIGPDV